MIFQTLKEYIKEDLGKVNMGGFKARLRSARKRSDSDSRTIEKNSGRMGLSPAKAVMLLLWRKKLQIILLTVGFMVVLAAIFGISNRNTLTATLTLNYEEASKGLNPNGTRFNMYEVKAHDVMERAISYMGIPDELTAEELSENISVSDTNSKAINTQDSEYFISTSFNVSYKRNRGVDNSLTTRQMMDFICKAYNDIFHENYGEKRTALVYRQADKANMEYVEISDDMNNQASQIDLYLSKRVKENGTFKSEETGETFQTLRRMIENLINYDISKYNSFVLETGLAKNKEEFLDTLYYKNSVLDMEYQKSMAEYAVRQDGISKYDEAMIGTVMIPAINDKDEYYMSRTNIGIDYLAKDAEVNLSAAKDTLKEIEINNDIIAKISAGNPTVEDFEKADEMIEEINKSFEEISSLAMLTDREYIRYKTKDYLTFKEREKNFAQIISLDKVAACGVLFLIVISVIFYYVEKRKLANRGMRP